MPKCPKGKSWNTKTNSCSSNTKGVFKLALSLLIIISIIFGIYYYFYQYPKDITVWVFMPETDNDYNITILLNDKEVLDESYNWNNISSDPPLPEYFFNEKTTSMQFSITVMLFEAGSGEGGQIQERQFNLSDGKYIHINVDETGKINFVQYETQPTIM